MIYAKNVDVPNSMNSLHYNYCSVTITKCKYWKSHSGSALPTFGIRPKVNVLESLLWLSNSDSNPKIPITPPTRPSPFEANFVWL